MDLAKVGIEVELKTEDWGAYLEHRNEGKFPMWMLGWGSDNGDPDNFIGWHFIHPVGEPKEEDCYDNDELAQLLIDGAQEPDVAKRETIYQQAEQIVHDDMPRLPIAWPAGQSVLAQGGQGLRAGRRSRVVPLGIDRGRVAGALTSALRYGGQP